VWLVESALALPFRQEREAAAADIVEVKRKNDLRPMVIAESS
jgi:hypothetical protein